MSAVLRFLPVCLLLGCLVVAAVKIATSGGNRAADNQAAVSGFDPRRQPPSSSAEAPHFRASRPRLQPSTDRAETKLPPVHANVQLLPSDELADTQMPVLQGPALFYANQYAPPAEIAELGDFPGEEDEATEVVPPTGEEDQANEAPDSIDLPCDDVGQLGEDPEAGDAHDGHAPGSEDLPSDQPEAEPSRPDASPSAQPPPPEPPRRTLTPQMTTLRDRVRKTLATYHRPLLNTQDNTAAEILRACLAFGCQTQVYRVMGQRQQVNGITCLCWDYPCNGYRLLTHSGGHVAPRIGYGFQEAPAQFLGMLALSRVPDDYAVRVGEDVRTVADLVEHEKLTCRPGSDLSWKLIGLMYYVTGEATWQDSLGEDWSVERIIRAELARPAQEASAAGIIRLMGLGYAVQRRIQRDRPVDGQFARAQQYVANFHDYAFRAQNDDGSWSPHFLAGRGTGGAWSARLRSTGHILEWLAVSLPDERLAEPPVVRAVAHVNSLLGTDRSRTELRLRSTQEIEAVMHALHALAVYDDRYFKPADPPRPQPAPDASDDATASRPSRPGPSR